MLRFFVYPVVCGLMSLSLFAQEGPERPACNAVTVGKLWPLQANGNYQLTNKLFNCGELSFCTRGKWRYRWSSLSVNVDQLSKNGQQRHRSSSCTALMNDLGKAERQGELGPAARTSGLSASTGAQAANGTP